MIWLGPYLVACLLLVGAGAAKALRPQNTARALAGVLGPFAGRSGRAGRATSPGATVVRVAATAEAALGIAGLARPSTATSLAVALSYLVFAGVVALARSRGGALSSCGCFGEPDTPATGLHVVIDLVLGGCAIWAAVATAARPWSISGVVAHQPLSGVPLLGAVATTAYLVFVALTSLARLGAARAVLRVSGER